MKLDILTTDGSPLFVTSKTLWGDNWQVGVGGAEASLLTLCEMWTHAGHLVTLYNNPRELGASIFEQRNISDFNPKANRDILIVFRSPNPQAIIANGMKIFFSCDQYTNGDYRKFAPIMDKIVCISPYHATYFANNYGIENTTVIDLPVRVWDYDGLKIEKVLNRLIFTSVPERGLVHLRKIWERLISAVPDISLVITSDYRLWGAEHGAMNEKHRVSWLQQSSVQFLGAVPRKRLIEEELKADILAYPASYEELACISCMEAQYAGAYPITSGKGALSTTNMGTIIPGNANEWEFLNTFSDTIIRLLKDREQLSALQKEVKQRALERFHPDIIMKEWNKIFSEAK
jgi:glycosyltransferase involved in cell wall biosynthesis